MSLPQAERREELHFHVGKSLSYATRLKVAFNLVFAGLVVQILTPPYFYVGLPIMFVGILFVLTKGYDNTMHGRRSGSSWRPATLDQATRIMNIDRQSKDWDLDSIDITNSQGCAVFGALTILIVGGTLSLYHFGHEQLAYMLPANAAVLMLPFWFTGTRSIIKKDALILQTKFLLDIYRKVKTRLTESEHFEFQIRSVTVRDGSSTGQEPRDIKAGIRWSDASDDFLGLQMQVSINQVQGRKYPYYYCVLVAKHGGDLLSVIDRGSRPPGIVAENESDDDVDVLVIRQKTTKNSGYHTDLGAASRILDLALTWGREVAEAATPK
jgi:hypothetical protein